MVNAEYRDNGNNGNDEDVDEHRQHANIVARLQDLTSSSKVIYAGSRRHTRLDTCSAELSFVLRFNFVLHGSVARRLELSHFGDVHVSQSEASSVCKDSLLSIVHNLLIFGRTSRLLSLHVSMSEPQPIWKYSGRRLRKRKCGASSTNSW